MYQDNINRKKAGVAMLISDEVTFRPKAVTGSKKIISHR